MLRFAPAGAGICDTNTSLGPIDYTLDSRPVLCAPDDPGKRPVYEQPEASENLALNQHMLAHLVDAADAVDMSLVVADTNIRELVEQAVPNLTLTIQRNLEVPEEPIEFSFARVRGSQQYCRRHSAFF